MSKSSKKSVSDVPQTGVRGESRRSTMIPTMAAAVGTATGDNASSIVASKSGGVEEKKDIWTLVIDHLNDEKRKADSVAAANKADDKAPETGGDAKAMAGDKDGKDNK